MSAIIDPSALQQGVSAIPHVGSMGGFNTIRGGQALPPYYVVGGSVSGEAEAIRSETNNLAPAIEPAALALLNGRTKPVINNLFAFLTLQARKKLVSIRGHHLLAPIDSDTGKHKLVVRQFVDLDAEAFGAYWESLIQPVDDWVSRLPRDEVAVVDNDIIIDVLPSFVR